MENKKSLALYLSIAWALKQYTTLVLGCPLKEGRDESMSAATEKIQAVAFLCCALVGVLTQMCAGAIGGQRRALDPLERSYRGWRAATPRRCWEPRSGSLQEQ